MFVPGRSRFPEPGRAPMAGWEFSQDSSEALLRSIASHITSGNVTGLGRVLVNAEAARQIAAESRRGDHEAFWGSVWRFIPGLPLAVDRKRFVDFMVGQGPAARDSMNELLKKQSKADE
jgi:hypothetical protein